MAAGADELGGAVVMATAGLEEGGDDTTAGLDGKATVEGEDEGAGVDNATSLAGVMVDAQPAMITTNGAANAMITRRRRSADALPSGDRGEFDG